MSNRFYYPFKNARLKAFFFFLLLATVFWILTKFSRQYTASAKANIQYINIPDATLIADNNVNEIEFDLTTSGFEFLYYNLKKPSIKIDVSSYYREGEKNVVITKNELAKLISAQLGTNLRVQNLSSNQLSIGLDAIISKKVPVIAQTKFTFKDGFRMVDSVKVKPDSVLVSGPSAFLVEVNSIETIEILKNDLDENLSLTVLLKEQENNRISFSPKQVNVIVEVAEFSQKEMMVPIDLINVPQGTVVKLIPNVVSVTFNVSVEDFKEITEKDFRLVCDFNERNADEDFMVLKLAASPAGIYNIELRTKKIDYLIFK
jgi:hypothetical protein